jgi:hypothetical protein
MNKDIPDFLKIIKEDWFEFFCELGFLFYKNLFNDQGSVTAKLKSTVFAR